MTKEQTPHENVSKINPETTQEIAYAAGVDMAWSANQMRDYEIKLEGEIDENEKTVLQWEDANIASEDLADAAGMAFGPNKEGDPTIDRSYDSVDLSEFNDEDLPLEEVK